MAVQALTDEIRQRRDAVLHWSHRHQKSSLEREEEHELPRRAVQYRVRADGWSLRGRPTPSAQESVEEGSGQTHQVDGKTTPTATTCTTTQTARERAGALTSPSSCLDGSVTRVVPGRYSQYTRADFGPEAVGSSNHRHITSPNVKPHGRVKSRKSTQN